MTVNRPKSREQGVPTLLEVDKSELDKLVPDIKHDIVELLGSEPMVNSQKVVLCMQYALYEHVLLNDLFVENVLTDEFRAGIDDILSIFRQLNRLKDQQVKRENINDRAEAITAFLMNSIYLAKEGLRDTSYVGMDVNKGVNETVIEINEIIHPGKKKSE